jgi:acyl-coenzyme A synthetase/AMP-(fatty) acid ligase
MDGADPRLLVDRILETVARAPEAPAIIAGDAAITYRALLALLSNTVKHLHERGVKPGDVVALTMGQAPMQLILLIALARLGAIVVSVPPVYRLPERTEIYRRFAIGTVVSEWGDAGVEGTKSIVVQGASARGDESHLDFGGFVPTAATPMRIGLTSGTTGTPKGVLQTHGGFVDRMDRMACGEGRNARVIPPSLHITAAVNLALFALCAGGSVVFPRDYENASFFDAILRKGVTHVGLPPVHLALMLQGLPLDQPAFPSIRHLRLMGGTPSAALLDLARTRFSPHLYLPYAISEIGVVSMAGPGELASAPGTSGRIEPGVRLEVLDEEGAPLPAGRSGEIRVAIEGMPAGYHGPDFADRTRFRDGWFYPGDRGHVSPEGLVFIEGRSDDIVNVGGRKVTPVFIERILEEHPAVREVAVFVSGEGMEGTRLAAAIVASGPIDWRDLQSFAQSRLSVLAPSRYFLVTSLPRNAMGKLVRDGLLEWVQARAAGAGVTGSDAG